MVSTATVLVADDDPAKRYLINRWLRRAGFTVVGADNGEEALARAGDNPDLIVLDVKLPDMSGFEVCWKLKANPATAHIPVLHLSAHLATAEDRVTGLEGGADAYLAYPVEPEELIATVRALLRVRNAESALRESEERFRLVGRATNDVVWDWDLRTSTVVWNDAAEALFKIPAERIEGTSEWWYGRIHPDDRPRVVAGLRAVIDGAGEYWCDEYRLLRGDETYATVFDRGFVVHSEVREPVRMVGSMLDVTERKRTEDARQFLGDASTLLAGSLQYETTLKSVARLAVPRIADWCIVYIVDEGGAIRPLEVAAANPSEERRLWAIQRNYPINPASRTDAVARVVRGGPAEILTGDGSGHAAAFHDDDERAPRSKTETPVSSIVVPLRARGRSLGAMVLSSTSRARRYGREQLRVAQELAERAAMAVDNARLYETAVVANRAKGDFLAVISHELRTPLNAILGYSDLLTLGIPGSVSEEARGYVERVQSCAKHLLTLIEQILIFSRMESGREQPVREPVSARDLARETALLVEPLAAEKGLKFVVAGDVPDVTVVSDWAKVNQILLALFSNAIKFTDEGEVTLRVRTEPGRLVFDVSDSGIGITRENIEKIFDPFWQVEQQKTRTAGGTGLGLTVARRLAQLLDGDVVVTSRPNRGSTFSLWLPVA